MINYADYEFYTDTYKGSLSSSLFNSLIPKASREIDKVVNRDIKEADLEADYGDKIRFVACELVDYLNIINVGNNTNRELSSISIDGVSKVYKTYTDQEVNSKKIRIINGLPHELTRFL